MNEKFHPYYHEVNHGVIIGPLTRRYGFFRDNKQLFEFNHFENDEQAIEWVKLKYPDEFKIGLEMRCYN